MSEDKDRGLWVGIPVPRAIIPADSSIYSMLPQKDPHITLAHLGRHGARSGEYVDLIHRRLIEIARPLGKAPLREVSAEVTGVGWFWRQGFAVKVALINSHELWEMRLALLQCLKTHAIDYDRQYGFIPHITLSSKAEPSGIGTPVKLTLPTPVLAWGDGRYEL